MKGASGNHGLVARQVTNTKPTGSSAVPNPARPTKQWRKIARASGDAYAELRQQYDAAYPDTDKSEVPVSTSPTDPQKVRADDARLTESQVVGCVSLAVVSADGSEDK